MGSEGDSDADQLDADAFIEREVERAVKPYRGILPPEAIEAMRDLLGDMLATHPVASRMVDRLTRAPIVSSSGPIEEDDAEPSTAPAVEKEEVGARAREKGGR